MLTTRWLLIALAVAMLGCGEEASDRAGRAMAAGAPREPVTFTTAEALRAFLCTLSTAEDRIGMLNLVYTEIHLEEVVLAWQRGILRARLDYAHALNDQFGIDGTEIEPVDAAMTAFVAAMCEATLEQINPVLARASFVLADGTEQVLILERRGTWKIHLSTLTGGTEVTDVWFFSRQFRYAALVKYHRDVTQQIREGAFATAEEARARLAELLAGPPPPMGSVSP